MVQCSSISWMERGVPVEKKISAWREWIPSLADAMQITPIREGFSFDRKYLVIHRDGRKLLLRTAELRHYDRKRAEYEVMQAIRKYDAKSPIPLEMGKIMPLGLCYYILSYIEGEDARRVLPQLTPSEQYQIGWEAGQTLARLHRHPAPATTGPWYERIVNKTKGYVDSYRTCGIKIRHDEKIITFLEDNKHYLQDRPNQFQHDDYHVGNLIVSGRAFAGVIDFNRFDWGDPLHDFCKLALFSRECSVPFSAGQIAGYFGRERIPELFWKLYAMYAAISVFSSIVWSVRVTPDKVEEMRHRLLALCEDHDDFDSCIPAWYRNWGMSE